MLPRQIKPFVYRTVWMGVSLLPLLASAAPADDAGTPISWHEGPALQRQLAQPADLVWSNQPVREGLMQLSKLHRVAILLDRRIDPDQTVRLRARQVPVGELIKQIAQQCSAETSLVGSVVYVGPPATAAKLRTLAAVRSDEAQKLPDEVRRLVSARRPLIWPELTQPRELIEELASEVRLTLAEPQLVPHDLWPAADLPPMCWTDRMTLVLAQFDLTFSVQGGTVDLAPIPATVQLTRSYPGGKQPNVAAHRFASLAPKAQVKVVGDKVLVTGSLDDHDRISGKQSETGPKPRPAADPLADQRFNLKVAEQPVGPLLRALCEHLKMELSLDERAIANAGIDLQRRVSFEVDQATIDELLSAMLTPAGMTAQRNGMQLEVKPAE